eukprot:TRINITY_DN4496_c0_g1_i1.p1 TRINITY_DN4496_c0_g1~~TRINITY_DN4496_c0_g1_i1.p1  ORF type:complete len:141 (+),score=29.83 TRINITY_DN4496_c0_g1_i1:489-911(+)
MEDTKEKKVVTPGKRKLEVKRRRRIDHLGELVISRKTNIVSLLSPFDPLDFLPPSTLQSGSSAESLVSRGFGDDIEDPQEVMLRPILSRIYKNIYVFNDNDDGIDDIEKRYKYLSSGFKSFLKQKRKQNIGKGPSEFIES